MVNTSSTIFVIIVAAGSGSRFGSTVPKQFLNLDGKPVLAHSVETFQTVLPDARIILVLSKDGIGMWSDLARRYNLPSVPMVVGGSVRSESVRNALEACKTLGARPGDIIMVHDGARPLLTPALIRRMVESMERSEAAVPACNLTDSIMKVEQGKGWGADRSEFRTVQTPQTFRASLIFDAYRNADFQKHTFTDDASVVQHFTGKGVELVEGDSTNIKITHPDDLEIARLILHKG